MIKLQSLQTICLGVILGFTTYASAQDVMAPPSLGQETKGEPATIEQETAASVPLVQESAEESQQNTSGLLGETEINEQRRENGQVYRIELKHSSGTTQYIDEDSDGKLDNSDDIDEAPNLAKWRIGSW